MKWFFQMISDAFRYSEENGRSIKITPTSAYGRATTTIKCSVVDSFSIGRPPQSVFTGLFTRHESVSSTALANYRYPTTRLYADTFRYSVFMSMTWAWDNNIYKVRLSRRSQLLYLVGRYFLFLFIYLFLLHT